MYGDNGGELTSKQREKGFFLNDKGVEQYHEKCMGCENTCKQSFRCEAVLCRKYKENKKGRSK